MPNRRITTREVVLGGLLLGVPLLVYIDRLLDGRYDDAEDGPVQQAVIDTTEEPPKYNSDLVHFASLFRNADQIQGFLVGISRERKSDQQVYGVSDYWASTKVVLERVQDDCDGGAMLGASLVRRALKRRANLLYLRKLGEREDHMVTVYIDDEGNYCSVGVRPKDRARGFPKLGDLVAALGYEQWNVLQPENLVPEGEDWETTNRNMATRVITAPSSQVDEEAIRKLFDEEVKAKVAESETGTEEAKK